MAYVPIPYPSFVYPSTATDPPVIVNNATDAAAVAASVPGPVSGNATMIAATPAAVIAPAPAPVWSKAPSVDYKNKKKEQ